MKHPELTIPWIMAAPLALPAFFKHLLSPQVSEWFYEAHRNGTPMAFTEKLEDMIVEELATFDDCPGKEYGSRFSTEKQPISMRYRMYVCDDLNGKVLGIARFLLGDRCYVGIPYNIFYNTIDDVAKDCDRIRFSPSRFFGGKKEGGKIEWGTDLGIKLMESLVLTPEEKRFMVQRLIQEADSTNLPGYETMAVGLPLVFAGMINAWVKMLITRLRPLGAPAPFLWPFYITTVAIGIFSVDWTRRYLRNYVDLLSDKLTAQIGPKYSQAGISYMEKIMARNRYLNGIMERAKMDRMYSADGDYLPGRIFSTPMTSLKNRLGMLNSIAAEQKKKESERVS